MRHAVLCLPVIIALAGCQSSRMFQTMFPGSQQSVLAKATAAVKKGAAAEAKGDFVAAKTAYGDVLKLDPKNALAHHRLGVIADRQKNFREAEQHYRLSLLAKPSQPNVLSDLGYSYVLQGRHAEGRQMLQAALAVKPDHKLARANLAKLNSVMPTNRRRNIALVGASGPTNSRVPVSAGPQPMAGHGPALHAPIAGPAPMVAMPPIVRPEGMSDATWAIHKKMLEAKARGVSARKVAKAKEQAELRRRMEAARAGLANNGPTITAQGIVPVQRPLGPVRNNSLPRTNANPLDSMPMWRGAPTPAASTQPAPVGHPRTGAPSRNHAAHIGLSAGPGGMGAVTAPQTNAPHVYTPKYQGSTAPASHLYSHGGPSLYSRSAAPQSRPLQQPSRVVNVPGLAPNVPGQTRQPYAAGANTRPW